MGRTEKGHIINGHQSCNIKLAKSTTTTREFPWMFIVSENREIYRHVYCNDTHGSPYLALQKSQDIGHNEGKRLVLMLFAIYKLAQSCSSMAMLHIRIYKPGCWGCIGMYALQCTRGHDRFDGCWGPWLKLIRFDCFYSGVTTVSTVLMVGKHVHVDLRMFKSCIKVDFSQKLAWQFLW